MIAPAAAEEAVRKYGKTDQCAAIELIYGWVTNVKGAPLSNDDAAAIATDLRAALSSGFWRDDAADIRKHDPDMARLERIATALRVLQKNLPPYVEAWRREQLRSPSVSPVVPVQRTAELLRMVNSHGPFMDAVALPKRGAKPSFERDLAAHFSRRVREAWGAAGDQTRADAFAAAALAWLVPERPPSDAAIAKGRTRRTQRGT